MKESAEVRFWRKVDKNGPVSDYDKKPCWLWLPSVNDKRGYGTFHPEGTPRSVLSHRYSWELHRGIIPKGIFVLHHCDNCSCVNPDHLFLGTQSDNMLDMYEKKRADRKIGENHPLSKLDDEDVREIRASYIPKKMGPRRLSKLYGVSVPTIEAILKRKTWRHVQ